MAKHILPQLPYKFDALEPYIDGKTMELHVTKHHQAYIDKLNAVIEKYPELEEFTAENLISDLSKVPDEIRGAVRNNGGGHVNHTFFWQVMTPNNPEESEEEEEIKTELSHQFNSFEGFKEKFEEIAATRFGSGWAWLVLNNNGKLEIFSTPNQDSPLMDKKIPILGIDVWEHAYYLKYQNRRVEYIKAWWNVVNWKKVLENYHSAKSVSNNL